MIEHIQKKVTTEEMLAQLAEEAAELAQAALKLRRVYDGSNPTPTTYEDALGNLHEEIADVKLLLKVLHLDSPHINALHDNIMKDKAARWERRLASLPKVRTPEHDHAKVAELEAELARAMFYITAQKSCTTCKHGRTDMQFCAADCGECYVSESCVCAECFNGSRWEWVGADGNERAAAAEPGR